MGLQAVDPRDILGKRCYIGGDIPAVISGVLFRVNGSTEYEVVWWDGRTRKCEWVMPQELEVIDGPQATGRRDCGQPAG